MTSFQDSKRQGKIGETLFFSAHCDVVEPSPDLRCDFLVTATGDGIEIKSDSYTVDQTPNFFFERWSNVEAQKPGGPWQSQEKGVKYFVYFYPSSLTYFRFETNQLLEVLTHSLVDYRVKNIPNKGYTTQGFLVPRKELEHIYKQVTLGVHVTGRNF